MAQSFDVQCLLMNLFKPWFHVQLLHVIILRPGRGYRRQSVCDCDVTSKMSADEELLVYNI